MSAIADPRSRAESACFPRSLLFSLSSLAPPRHARCKQEPSTSALARQRGRRGVDEALEGRHLVVAVGKAEVGLLFTLL